MNRRKAIIGLVATAAAMMSGAGRSIAAGRNDTVCGNKESLFLDFNTGPQNIVFDVDSFEKITLQSPCGDVELSMKSIYEELKRDTKLIYKGKE